MFHIFLVSCDIKTCQNGGTCQRGFCSCPQDFLGDHCETGIFVNPRKQSEDFPGKTKLLSYIHSHLLGVRLVNGSTRNEGRVELFHQGNWGTVCDDDWDIKNAHVICKMLGYPRAIQALPSSAFGEGTGDIVLSNVNCSSEDDIFDCGHNEYLNHNCEHLEDAGVVCDNSKL